MKKTGLEPVFFFSSIVWGQPSKCNAQAARCTGGGGNGRKQRIYLYRGRVFHSPKTSEVRFYHIHFYDAMSVT
jgi:hypothetical protein